MKSIEDYKYNFREFKKLETSVFYPVARWMVKTITGETDSKLSEYLSNAGRWEKFLLYLEVKGFFYGGAKMVQLSTEKINEKFDKVLEKLNQEKERISKAPLSDLEEIIKERKKDLIQLVKDGVPRKTICDLIYEEFSDLCGDKQPSVRWLNRVLGTHNVIPKKKINKSESKINKSESKKSKNSDSSNENTAKTFDSLG
jgi:hypothetical protein